MYRKQDGQEELVGWGDGAADRPASAAVTAAKLEDPVLVTRDWFKIFLHNGYFKLYQAREQEVRHQDVKRWITDYLTCLHAWIKSSARPQSARTDWADIEIVFAFAVPDRWVLEDRDAISDYSACIKDAGFGGDGPGHRVLMESEAAAAASYFNKTEAGLFCTDRQQVIVIDAGGSTVDIALCIARVFNGVTSFTSTQSIGSITTLGGTNYLMRLEQSFERKLLRGSDTTRSALPWSLLRPRVRQHLREEDTTVQLLEESPSECTVIFRDLGMFPDDVAAGIRRSCITLSP